MAVFLYIYHAVEQHACLWSAMYIVPIKGVCSMSVLAYALERSPFSNDATK